MDRVWLEKKTNTNKKKPFCRRFPLNCYTLMDGYVEILIRRNLLVLARRYGEDGKKLNCK